ncbi:MAG: hypothetical protein ACOYKZ_06835 [Chlamydiia bacterium]
MKAITRVLCGALIVLASPAMAADKVASPQQPSAAVNSAQQAKSNSYAPWVVLAVLVVGGIAAGLAASHSYPSGGGGGASVSSGR